MCTACMPTGSPALRLQMTVINHVGVGNPIQVLYKSGKCTSC